MHTRTPWIIPIRIFLLFSLLLAACSSSATGILEYAGNFTMDYLDATFKVGENVIHLKVYPEADAITGTGKVVVTKPSAFEGDSGTTETYNLDFEVKYVADTDGFTGQVHITGGSKCFINCEGVDDYDLDYYADWRGQLVEYDQTILGKADNGAFDFTAAKVK